MSWELALGGLLDLSCAVLALSQMTQSGMGIMNDDPCLAETVGCFNDIIERLYYSYLFNLCEYKVYVIVNTHI